MSNLPADLKYTASHEWVRDEGDGVVTIGITDHAQELLGDLVYVELPETGREVDAEEAIAVVESVKAASDVYAPMPGEIVEVNEVLSDSPELINTDAHGEGWLLKMKVGTGALDDLLDVDGYQAVLDEEG